MQPSKSWKLGCGEAQNRGICHLRLWQQWWWQSTRSRNSQEIEIARHRTEAWRILRCCGSAWCLEERSCSFFSRFFYFANSSKSKYFFLQATSTNACLCLLIRNYKVAADVRTVSLANEVLSASECWWHEVNNTCNVRMNLEKLSRRIILRHVLPAPKSMSLVVLIGRKRQ